MMYLNFGSPKGLLKIVDTKRYNTLKSTLES